MKHTPEDVARWMRADLNKHDGYLAQQDAVAEIERRFGRRFTYDNQRGNPAIARDVLDAFRKLSEKTVVWMKSERAWRRRERGDGRGRRVE